MDYESHGISIECIQGDIASQPDIEAVVNAANAELKTGGGVAGAVHRAAGPELAEACAPMAPIKPGEAVISEAFDLPNSYVIHCLGPVYGNDKPEDRLLANCYKNALNLTEKQSISSIAFPAISTGAFGYPVEAATRITFKTVQKKAPALTSLKKIRFVLYSEQDLLIYNRIAETFFK